MPVMLSKAEVLFRIGNWAEAEKIYRWGIEVLENIGDHRMGVIITNRLAMLLGYRGLNQEALDLLTKTVEQYQSVIDETLESEVMKNFGFFYEELGNYNKAIECHQRSLELCQKLDNRRGVASGNGNLGIIYAKLGDFVQSMERFKSLLKISEDLSDIHGISLAQGNLGLLYIQTGDLQKATEALKQKYQLSERMGDRLGILQAIGSLGDLNLKYQQYEEAYRCFHIALRHAREMENHHFTILALQRMGQAKWHLGEEALALDLIEQAVDLAKKYDMKFYEADVIMVKARLLKGRGRNNESLAVLRRVQELAESIGHDLIKLETSLLMAEIMIESGENATAVKLVEDASKLCRKVRHPDLMGRTEALCRQLGMLYDVGDSEAS